MEALRRPEKTAPHAQLPPPRELRAALPRGESIARVVRSTRRAIRDVIHGRDPRRLVVVVGPCSIHDPAAALEYARALAKVAHDTREQLVIVMRTYVEKPRTALGWKGIAKDPLLDGSCDVAAGVALARRVLCDLGELGVACASELLDPLLTPYLEDLLAWGVIGARTAESPAHRELASGLPLPVGFKHGRDGSIESARDAMLAAGHAHAHLGIDAAGRACIVRTRGNPDRHLVLRGGCRPNYGSAHLRRALEMLAPQGIARPLMVDCSHGNSAKDHTRQARVFDAVLQRFAAGVRGLMGLMLESYLRPGRQDLRPGVALEYGVSITDGCIGWDETERLLYAAAEIVETAAGAPAARRLAVTGIGER